MAADEYIPGLAKNDGKDSGKQLQFAPVIRAHGLGIKLPAADHNSVVAC